MRYVPLDIETTGLSFKKDRILGIGIGKEYSTQLISTEAPATAHNGKFEAKFLRANNLPFTWAFDTLLASSILLKRPKDLDLASVAEYYLNMPSWKSDTDKLFKKKYWVRLLEADPVLQKALADRNIYDLKATEQLTEVLLHQLDKEGMTNFFFEKLMPAARLLVDMEYRGMRIDVSKVETTLTQLNTQIGQLKTRLDSWCYPIALNWNSPIQLKKFLKDKGYELWTYDFKKKATVESTGSDVLENLLPNENIRLLLDYRGAIKLHGFLSGWLEDKVDDRLYPSYNVASTRTGRLSCSAPNLQQVPRDKEIRSLFIPSPGKVFVIGDYSQVEVRVAAHYTEDETLTKIFEEELDFYGSIAINVLGVKCHANDVKRLYPKERKVAKEIGLSILYGIGAAKLSSIIKKKAGVLISKEECSQIIKDYFKSYPKLKEFRDHIIGKIERGEILRTKYGRQFIIDPEKSFSTGVNTIVQSTASDACLFSQLEVEKRLKEEGIEAPLVGIIHDEIVRECDEIHAQKVGTIMEEVMCNQGLRCPLKLDWSICTDWGQKS